jgi:hypothetical protein
MSKYYMITLKNGRTYEARDVRLNGLPLAGLHMLIGPGRLDFLALPATAVGALGSFSSMRGIDTELDIVDPTIPGRRCTRRGRVTSATGSPGTATPGQPRTETIVIVCEELKSY